MLAGGLVAAACGQAMETDQYTHRDQQLEDSTAVLNREVNLALTDVLGEHGHRNDPIKLTAEVYQRLGGPTVVDRLERWALESDEVDKIWVERADSIYRGIPAWASRSIFLFGLGATIRLDGVLVGSDKIGHFFSQGRKFYVRYLRLGEEAAAARWSAFTERAIFGRLTTGVYSNADLIANFEGHRFYRSLFEPGVIDGKPAILKWTGERWVQQRPFDWADHVNPYWDEARNVNDYDRLLKRRVIENIKRFCPDYYARPSLYSLPASAELDRRYAILGLRDTSTLRLEHLCESEEGEIGARVVGREQGGTPRTGVTGHR